MAGDSEAIARFVARWRANEGGAERANYVLFLTELCALLDLPGPDPADASHAHNDYVFERAVTFEDADGRTSRGRIDLYKRGCFVLEAKQSRERGGNKEVALGDQPALPGIEGARGRRSAHRGWDVLMRNAREQAEQYARALPASHGWPPFLLVVDVGHAIEMFADFSGQGKNYRQFPDRGGFRVYLDDLHDAKVRERLTGIWLDPHSLDPAKRSAVVTRDIAKRLASVSKLLEDRGHQPEPVAHFLMRCLFTMFAEEDKVALLPPGSFTAFLEEVRGNPRSFAPLLEELWRAMDSGGLSTVLREDVRKFNGGLFADQKAIPLNCEEIGELYEAARHDWTEVEPAIFGTLLEQALDPKERRGLGAHYTPRAYVERLVVATIVGPLQREWEAEVLGTVERERAENPRAAIKAVHDFHEKLAAICVLDPACGTGNFLYVALELMKRLEGDVLQVLVDLGGQEALALETATVHPGNFLGIERNPRAAAIAELVLWLGYLQWQLRNGGIIADPVLRTLNNIERRDAILRHDDARPDFDCRADELPNPRPAAWPEADYIVGNPPFVGKGAAMREALGEPYLKALWTAHPHINKSADLVMYWWDRAAGLLAREGTRLKRFGLVTTNSITQEFSRRVIGRRLHGRPALSLTMAVPDHPWFKSGSDSADVRIAMTVVEPGERDGTLHRVVHESDLGGDQPRIEMSSSRGRLNSNLTIGVDVNEAAVLLANDGLCANGMLLAGRGFVLSPRERAFFDADNGGLIKPYIGGSELMQRRQGRSVIDAFGIDADELRKAYPQIYQHLTTSVKPVRAANNRATYREKWWQFAEPRSSFRPALSGLERYVATVETAKHRIFQFLPKNMVPDHMVVAFASDDAYVLGVLSSRIHLSWTYANCALLGVAKFEQGHRYTKSKIFDRFAFPDVTAELRERIRALGEELDDARKTVLSRDPDLTATGLYNVLEKVKAGTALDPDEEDRRRRGRIDILIELHGRIDGSVAAAYGWPADLAAEAIVSRLVALNAQRRGEEKTGTVRWLRPDYQLGRAGVTRLQPAGASQIEAALPAAEPRKPAFPRDAIGQTAAVLAALRGGGALDSAAIAARYAQGRRIELRVAATLAALARLGHLSREADGYRLRKAA